MTFEQITVLGRISFLGNQTKQTNKQNLKFRILLWLIFIKMCTCSKRCTVFGALCKGANNSTLWLQSSQYTGLYTVACLKLHKGAFQNKTPSFKMFILITSTCWTELVLRWLSSFKMFGLTGKFNKLHWIPDYYTCAPGKGSREYIGIILIIYV